MLKIPASPWSHVPNPKFIDARKGIWSLKHPRIELPDGDWSTRG